MTQGKLIQCREAILEAKKDLSAVSYASVQYYLLGKYFTQANLHPKFCLTSMSLEMEQFHNFRAL